MLCLTNFVIIEVVVDENNILNYKAHKTIGNIIRDLRSQRRSENGRPLSQMELSYMIGWENPSTLSRIEKGEVFPTKETLLKIIKVLGLGYVESTFVLKIAGYFQEVSTNSDEYLSEMLKYFKLSFDKSTYPVAVTFLSKIFYLNKATLSFIGTNKKISKEMTFWDLYYGKGFNVKDRILNWKDYVENAALRFKYYLYIIDETGIYNSIIENSVDLAPDFVNAIKKVKLSQFKDNINFHNFLIEYLHSVFGKMHIIKSGSQFYMDERFLIEQFFPVSSEVPSLHL